MPRYVVCEERSYVERWLIEADSETEAKQLGGRVLDHDSGEGSDTGQIIWAREVDVEQDELS